MEIKKYPKTRREEKQTIRFRFYGGVCWCAEKERGIWHFKIVSVCEKEGEEEKREREGEEGSYYNAKKQS